jgi:hypothetical protein
MSIKINWTDEKITKMKVLVENWLRKYDCYSGEHVGQCDDCQIYAGILVGNLADLLVDEHEWD